MKVVGVRGCAQSGAAAGAPARRALGVRGPTPSPRSALTAAALQSFSLRETLSPNLRRALIYVSKLYLELGVSTI